MSEKIDLENISIVLSRPRYSENIGAAARVMCNMGIGGRLIVVEPPNYEQDKALKLATHVGRDIVENAAFFDSLTDALAPFNYVVGTSARLGSRRQAINSPPEMAKKLIPISKKNQIAILFGPEDRGLSNLDLRSCHLLVNIPTAHFSSLNLAQAVMVICYELHNATLEFSENFSPRLANRHELDGMYEQLKEILVRISFINSENPDYWLNNFRHFFSRLPLKAKEVKLIRGIIRQINWYGEKRYRDGLRDAPKK